MVSNMNREITGNTYAAFTHLSCPLIDRLSIVLGLRYEQSEKDLEVHTVNKQTSDDWDAITSKIDQLKKMGATFDFGIDDEKEIQTWSPEIRHLKTDFLMKRHPERWGFVLGQVMANIPFLKFTCFPVG